MIKKCPPFTPPPPQLQNAAWDQKISYVIASTFWTGHLPASGTWGALVAWILHTFLFPNALTLENWPIALSLLGAVILIGIWTGDQVEKMTGIKDDSRVTVDEVAGYFLAVLFVPAGWQYTVPAFLLARAFDILKPPPANALQGLKGGLGIMVDDLIASVYAVLIMHFGLYLLGVY
ncbi:MAG: phosphatidylglycerophosphatase A [Candidatus Omnitrophica bacterium]|nr:phosphatidylglycerophosphatase A [Candidatus Omnitrophota bacterium]